MKNSEQPTQKDLLIFTIIWFFVFIVIALYPLKSGQDVRLWAVGLSIIFLALSFVPIILLPIYKLWVKFGMLVGKINSFLILNLLFYIIITPMGLIVRLFGGDLLSKKIDKNRDSYWNEHQGGGSMKQQF